MNNLIKESLTKLKQKNINNPELDLRILLKHASKKNNEIILSNFNIENINLRKFFSAFDRRIKGEPVSKIYNSKSFWKHNFFVNKDVLDPRPDTEIIIEKVLEHYPETNKFIKILDLCTGSGCLAVSLAKEYPNSKITATDICPAAIKVAKKNAILMNCANQIKFLNCDLINEKDLFDIVVANPPYLSKYEYGSISPNIHKYEPKIALLASRGGYEFYWKIANILNSILNINAKIFVEIGFSQADKVINIFSSKRLLCLKVEKDIQNLNRLLILNKS